MTTGLNNFIINPRSFKDNDAIVFSLNGIYFRAIKNSYKLHYEHLINSGLHQNLTSLNYLISHSYEKFDQELIPDTFIYCKPDQLNFISFPAEWCFSQFQDSAITTLEITKKSLEYGMILKDASFLNIQLHEGKTILIDTSSFVLFNEGEYWKGYKQFVEHYFIPLIISNNTSSEFFKILLNFHDGIPIWKSLSFFKFLDYFNLHVFIHIYLFSKSSKKTNTYTKIGIRKKSKLSIQGIIDSLQSGIVKLKPGSIKSAWKDYYSTSNNYENESFDFKSQYILNIVEKKYFKKVLDLGSNTGHFSRIIHKHVGFVVSIDNDCDVVDINYQLNKKLAIKNIYPLVIDILNPTPSFGWKGMEYESFIERSKSDLVLALALIHHLYFKHYVSFNKMADLFYELGENLVIEFVEKEDSQILLFDELFEGQKVGYNSDAFENAFTKKFTILNKTKIPESNRLLYYFKRND
ncbi:hypothetical protein [Sediminibacterium sp.]|uniref:hypothetical protein n=1 Tax=Sediminibacterium sp. TaxID=1917865 RepID=UPI0025D2D3F7|nr:hypothetical protein [Sediminibacterium sp.]